MSEIRLQQRDERDSLKVKPTALVMCSNLNILEEGICRYKVCRVTASFTTTITPSIYKRLTSLLYVQPL
jgi:hypothetical protein